MTDARFVTVLRASSAIRIPPDQHFQYNMSQGDELWQLTFRTRYLDGGPGQRMPRELWVEVVGPGNNLDEAMRRAQGFANVGASVLSLGMNAGIDPLPIEYCFHASDERPDHEFHQNFLLDETGYPRTARVFKPEPVTMLIGSLSTHARAERLLRAIAQYELALRSFTPGQETIAVAHLWMAVEALTPVALEQELVLTGLDRDGLAASWGIEKKSLDPEVRRRLLLRNDTNVYSEAKKASDGFEHGFADFTTVHTTSTRVRDKLSVYVRYAIFELAGTSQECRDALLTPALDTAVPSSRVSKFLKCVLHGEPSRLASAAEQYPRFQLSSGMKKVVTEADGTVTIEPTEEATPVFGPGVYATDVKFEVWGPPGVTVTRSAGTATSLSSQTGQTVTESGPHLKDLLAAVTPLVDAAVSSGSELALTAPQALAFNLFGQGTAFFQSAKSLVEAGQPVESLPTLRGLVTIAARFEQVVAADGPGLGVVVSLVVDSLNREITESLDPSGMDTERIERARTQRDQLLSAAEATGLAVPADLPTPETSEIWRSLTAEMRLASRVVDTSYVITGLHIVRGDDPARAMFNTKLLPGPFTDMVGSACVIAQLDLLRHAALILGWTLDVGELDDLLVRARALNESSASPKDSSH